MTILQKLRPLLLDRGSDKIYITESDYDILNSTEWKEDWTGEPCDVVFHTDKDIWVIGDYDGSHTYQVIPKVLSEDHDCFSL